MKRFYALLLYLYPGKYREEYGEELQAVFNSLFEDALKMGRLDVAKFALRELLSLPEAIFFEHLRERRNTGMTKRFSSRFEFPPGSWTEAFAALAPFLVFGALPTLLGYFHILDHAPTWLDVITVIFFWCFGLSLLLMGIVGRFPRWFMPFIGAPMPVMSLLLFNRLMESWQGVWWYRLPGLLANFLQQGLLWIGLFSLVVLLSLVTRFNPNPGSFFRRLREDWTLLAFIIYGTLPFVLIITLDEYRNVEPFLFLAFWILAVWGWFYLRSDVPWNKYLFLHGGIAFSLLVVAAGKAITHESAIPWASSSLWQTGFLDTIFTWLWLALIMSIPLAIKWIPGPHTTSHHTSPT